MVPNHGGEKDECSNNDRKIILCKIKNVSEKKTPQRNEKLDPKEK
jgi:hypothetical protein